MVMPLVMPAPSMTAGGDAFTKMADRHAKSIATRAASRDLRQKNFTELAKAIIAQTGNMAKVYGGMQSGGVLEGMLGNKDVFGGISPLQQGMLTGAYTSGADSRRVAGENADIAATNRGGRGGGSGKAAKSNIPNAYVKLPDGRVVGVEDLDKAAQYYPGATAYVPTAGEAYEYLHNGNVIQGVFGGTSVPVLDGGDGGDTTIAPDMGTPPTVDIGGSSTGDNNLAQLQQTFPQSYRDESGQLHAVTEDGSDVVLEED